MSANTSNATDSTSSIDAQISAHVQRLEAAKSRLQQDPDNTETWDDIANTFRFFADTARDEKARTPIGESKAIALVVEVEALNKKRLTHVDMQAMRTFANICVDHEGNRQRVVDENAFATILEVFNAPDHGDAITTACGALLNTTMAYEPAQNKAIDLGAIEQLIKVLQLDDTDKHQVKMTIATRVLANLGDQDNGSQAIVQSKGIQAVVQLLERTSKNVDTYRDLFDALVDILRAVAIKESAQTTIHTEKLLPPLLDILEHTETSDEGKTEEEKKEDDKKFGETKAALVEVVVSVTLADANMKPVFNDKQVMDKFLGWLSLIDREDLQTCAALCIGNLARSDEHCLKLVHEYHAVEPLIHVVRKATDLKASHAATGVLKNLALPARNREVMGDAGVIQACSPLLKKDNALPLQNNVVGILKRLCVNNSHNTVRIISGREPFETLSSTSLNTENGLETPLSILVELITRTDDFALKSEGTRTICNLIKVIWGSDSMKEFDEASVTALQQSLNRPDVVLLIAAMTRNSKHFVLQSEGVIALILLVSSPVQGKNSVLESIISIETDPLPEQESSSNASEASQPSEQPPKIKPLTLLESLIALIRNAEGKIPDEIRTNVCVLLRNAIDAAARSDADPAYLTFLKSSGLKDQLLEISSQGETESKPLILSAIQEVLVRLE